MLVHKPRIIQLVGTTASGKTSFSIRLAKALNGEIVNVDSMQVYRTIQVGTDKPTSEEMDGIPIYGINLIDLGPPLDASTFAEYARQSIIDITSRDKACLLSGGTGLYHRATLYGLIDAPNRSDAVRTRLRAQRDALGQPAMYERLNEIDPISAKKISSSDWVRIERALEVYELTGTSLSQAHANHGFKSAYFDRLSIGCWRPREILYKRIEERLDEMWKAGIIEETKMMLDMGLSPDVLPIKALGYRQAALALTGQVSFEDALVMAKRETRRFAKRQMTWFRADQDTCWLDMSMNDAQFDAICEACRHFLKTGTIAFDAEVCVDRHKL